MNQKLTLAQFKRDAQTGHMGLELLERYGKKESTRIICPVIKVQQRGVCLKRNDRESYLAIPFASLIEYDGAYLKVYDKGKRDLNELEQKVMNGWKQIANTPEFKKREEYDLISDGSSTYYQKKFYFYNSSCPYLFTDTERLSYSIEDNKVRDSKIKGKCILKYKVHKI